MTRLLVFVATILWLFSSSLAQSARQRSSTQPSSQDLSAITDWRVFPQRSGDEAAVIEWGHSAIISAIDASVAYFGPQTSHAALFEVETTPILADPINGKVDNGDGDLINAAQMHGNVAVMTDTDRPCLDLALLAQRAHAAALIVVHVEEARPDDAPRCAIPPGREKEAEEIDIPVVTISLASVDVLTLATVTEDMQPEEVVNHGMPDRIRLYAGGDRPFFEDVESAEPTVYLIHNLLTSAECAVLVGSPRLYSPPPLTPEEERDAEDTAPVPRRIVYPLLVAGTALGAAVDERIEQVTGFPAAHFSEWHVERLDPGRTMDPHYDVLPGGGGVPHATISVFLTESSDSDDDSDNNSSSSSSGALVFPSTKRGGAIQVRPRAGLAVVHHNVVSSSSQQQHQKHDSYARHGWMPGDDDNGGVVYYVARRYVLPTPLSPARRYVLPLYTTRSGALPAWLQQWQAVCVAQFGPERGPRYWEQSLIALPVLVLLLLAYGVGQYVQAHFTQRRRNAATTTVASSSTPLATVAGGVKSKPKKQ